MTLYDKLQKASYKNVEFLVEARTKEAGKKTVIHNFPGTDDKQYVEELGTRPNKISMVIVVSETPGGNDITTELKRLESVLLEPGAGNLVDPIYGLLENMVCLGFNPEYRQTKIGQFRFTAEFTPTWVEVEQPEETTSTSAKVSDDFNKVQDDLLTATGDKLILPETAKTKIGLGDKITGMIDSMNDTISNITNPIASNLGEYINTANNIKNSIYTTMNTTEQIKGVLSDVTNTFINIASIPGDMKNAWDDLVNHSTTVVGQLDWEHLSDYINLGVTSPQSVINPDLIESTDGTIIGSMDYNGNGRLANESLADTSAYEDYVVSNNNQVIDEYVRMLSLAALYEVAAYEDYGTEDDIDATKSNLESQFKFNLDPVVEVGSIAPDMRDSLMTIRKDTLEVLNEKPANRWRVDTDNVKLSSVLLQTYLNYGDIDELDTMVNLNKDINCMNFRNSYKRRIG